MFLIGEVLLYPHALFDEANHELELFLDVACDQQTLSSSPTHSLSLILVEGRSFSYRSTSPIRKRPPP